MLDDAHHLPSDNRRSLGLLNRLFRVQVQGAKHQEFKAVIDKLEDKVIAWTKELDAIHDMRRRLPVR